MSLLDGPFEFLEGNWTFIALDENASKVELKLSYRFANRAFSMALKPIFTQIGNMMLDAFCERAKKVYAKVLSKKNKIINSLFINKVLRILCFI